MNELEKAIAHHKKLVKSTTGNQSHYALGALEVLLAIKATADEWREDMRRLWRDRGNPDAKAAHDAATAAWTSIVHTDYLAKNS